MFVSEVLAEAQGELMRLDGVGTAGYAGFFIRLRHSALRSLQSTNRKNATKRLSIVQYNLLPNCRQIAI